MNNCFSSYKLNEVLEEIREQIKDKKLSVTVLADEMGVARGSLSRMLNNRVTIKADYLFYLFYRLGMKVSY